MSAFFNVNYLVFGSKIMKNNIEKLRNEKGITKKTLADEIEVTLETLVALENNKYVPSILLAYRLAKYFQKNIEEIFVYEGD